MEITDVRDERDQLLTEKTQLNNHISQLETQITNLGEQVNPTFLRSPAR